VKRAASSVLARRSIAYIGENQAVAIPDVQSLMLPFLEVLQDGRQRTMREMTELLASRFNLTEAERQVRLPSGSNKLFYNRVAWAKAHLKNAGLIENPLLGMVDLSVEGREVLLQKPSTINFRFLKQFPSYLEFIGQAPRRSDEEQEDTGIESTKTPEEILEASYQALRNALASEILERVKSCSPRFFERLVVELLVAMGYGGSLSDAGAVIGRPGDEGIDGTIKEDKLGLDVVHIQAKRWKNTVGRPDVQKFAGSMEGQRARKGVMLTTSSFSDEAKEYVTHIERKIVLVDGLRLAQLMIDHDIGVATARAFIVKKLDQDYFEEEGS
jgi:restriction system protein